MSLDTAELVSRVHAAGGELEAKGDRLKWRAPAPLSADLLGTLKARKAEVLTHLRAAAAVSPAGDDVDDLFAMANQEAQVLPEHVPAVGYEGILVPSLLSPDTPPDTCPACRQAQWWTDSRSRLRICRVCHPPPSPECEQ